MPNAYEEIRSVENVKVGVIPTVATAPKLWKGLRYTDCSKAAFQTLLMRLENSFLLYRSALRAFAKVNERDGKNGD